MCGRFSLTKTGIDWPDVQDSIELPPLFSRRYNIAPTQSIATISGDSRRIEPMDWGIPTRHGGVVINARRESLHEKPLFRPLLATNRCLVLADGYYEWNNGTPYYFELDKKALFAFAGLWQANPATPGQRHCTIVTQSASPTVRRIHHRMPVILRMREWTAWLEQGQMMDDPPPLNVHPVSRHVGTVGNDDSRCIEPAAEQTNFGFDA